MDHELWDTDQSIARRFGYASARRYERAASFLFSGIDLQGSRVLEVGSGRGAFAVWAALQGASEVLGLEPETAGSAQGARSEFERVIEDLGLAKKVEVRPTAVEDLSDTAAFDVVLMYNVINHVDEDAVQRLVIDSGAWATYAAVARHLYRLCRPHGVLILADCSPHNLSAALGVRSPLTRTIEWSKHQPPEVWLSLFRANGFELLDIRWSPLYPLRASSRLLQFATKSHFVLRLHKSESTIQ